MAVFSRPVVLFNNAWKPMAVLRVPVVLAMSASSPWTVLPFVKHASWQVARACGESSNNARASGMRNKPRRKGGRFTEFVVSEVLVFIKHAFCSPDWLIVRLPVWTTGKGCQGKRLLRIQILVSVSFAKNLASLARQKEYLSRTSKISSVLLSIKANAEREEARRLIGRCCNRVRWVGVL